MDNRIAKKAVSLVGTSIEDEIQGMTTIRLKIRFGPKYQF